MNRSMLLLLALTALTFSHTSSFANKKSPPMKGKPAIPAKPMTPKKTVPSRNPSEFIEPIPALPDKGAQPPKKPTKTKMQNRINKLFENSNGVF